MKRQKSIGWNFIMNSILTVSAIIFPLITFPYVSRVLQPDGIGKVSFATSLITYFAMFAQLGIPTYGIRICAQVRDDKQKLTKTVHELVIINLIMSVITYAALAVALATVPKLKEDRALYILTSSMILLNVVGMEWLYRALEEYTYITVRSLVFKVISVASMFIFVRQKDDYLIYCGLTLIASHLSFVLNMLNAKKYIGIRWMGNYDLRRHLKPVFIFFAMSCATTIYTNLDTVMLGFMRTDAEVGFYNVAVKVRNLLLGLVASLGNVLLPRVSYYVQNGEMTAFWNVSKKALNLVMLIAAPLVLYFIMFAKQSILLLSGSEFLAATLPMRIITVTILFIGLTNILGIQILVPLGKEKTVLYSVILGAGIDLAVNVLLIPVLGAVGPTIGSFCAEFAVLCFQVYVLRKHVLGMIKSFPYLQIAAALGAGLLASIWVARMQWTPFVTLAVSATLFFISYGIVLILAKEKLTRELLGKIVSKLQNKLRA